MNQKISTRKIPFRTVLLGILSIAMAALLSACAGGPPKPEGLDIQVSATADVNPDMQGRPSPIILHVMELKSDEQFNRLDYMGLTQPAGSVLGPELLGKTQLILQPGESKALPMELNPQTTSIGLVAGYRDIDNAAWRRIIPITQGETKGINIVLEQTQITSTVSD